MTTAGYPAEQPYVDISKARTVFEWGPMSEKKTEGEEQPMNPDMLEALQALAADKGISVDALLAALADALESAYKRMPDSEEYAWVTINPETADIQVFAQKLDDDGEPIGEPFDVTPDGFGRIAAQTAKQVMMQRIREVERELKYEEYAGREGDIVTGIIQQNDARYTLLDLGRVEALLPQAEQVPFERPDANSRLKAYIVEVRKTAKGPQIVVSRTHPGLIRRLFELEVPEIADGVVEIKACAREPGHRTKIAVSSNDTNVDPVGACVGARGARVRMVVNELRGEKIDIVPFADDPRRLRGQGTVPRPRSKRSASMRRRAWPRWWFPIISCRWPSGRRARTPVCRLGSPDGGSTSRAKPSLPKKPLTRTWSGPRGEWVVDESTGEQVWRPAEGGPALSAEEWAAEGADAAPVEEVGQAVEGTPAQE